MPLTIPDYEIVLKPDRRENGPGGFLVRVLANGETILRNGWGCDREIAEGVGRERIARHWMNLNDPLPATVRYE